MSTFKTLSCNGDLKEIIKAAFSTDLDIDGAWGYTKELATQIKNTDIPMHQFEHTFASMRAYVEMNMTCEKEDRYGSITLNETSRESLTLDTVNYHKVTYEVTAMQESIYASFIQEYKDNYGEKDFDLSAHFKKRKKETLYRDVTHWFQLATT